MVDALAPQCPSGLEASPVIDYVNRAIDQAKTTLLTKKAGDPKDPFDVLAMALNIIIKTREKQTPASSDAGVTLQTPNCKDMDLAYADHYLQMRTEAFNLGPTQRGLMERKVIQYEKEKIDAIADGNAHERLRTGVCQPSPPTNMSLYWGLKGIEDGLEDWKVFPRTGIKKWIPRHIAW
jgi:hypothetical protein